MTLPLFSPEDDPGPTFAGLLDTIGRTPGHAELSAETLADLGVAHGTTVVAIKYDEGVVMAGDRRATAGHLISHRSIEKVFPADRHSGVAIAGAAGPAMEMVRLFQLQLEHYEKVEGSALSLDGKANQLGQMLRQNLPAAMQGLAVVPLFAGFDTKRGAGRLFQYDVTGGRYEEQDYATTGSGSLHAGTVVKLGYREGQDQHAAVDLAVSALFQAADEDSATGGPDPLRGIYPVVALITEDGYRRLSDDEVSDRFEGLIAALEEQHLPTGGEST